MGHQISCLHFAARSTPPPAAQVLAGLGRLAAQEGGDCEEQDEDAGCEYSGGTSAAAVIPIVLITFRAAIPIGIASFAAYARHRSAISRGAKHSSSPTVIFLGTMPAVVSAPGKVILVRESCEGVGG